VVLYDLSIGLGPIMCLYLYLGLCNRVFKFGRIFTTLPTLSMKTCVGTVSLCIMRSSDWFSSRSLGTLFRIASYSFRQFTYHGQIHSQLIPSRFKYEKDFLHLSIPQKAWYNEPQVTTKKEGALIKIALY
jgi:hypothetical protein